jgi:hypothetical protein
MRREKHLRILGIVSIAWILFLIVGYPDYYQQYSTEFMIVFDVVILPPIWYVVYKSAKRAKPGKGLIISLWWSFYITVPLFIYDLLYCGLFLGHGLNFLTLYWYLTVYYIIPWLFFPITGYIIDKKKFKKFYLISLNF